MNRSLVILVASLLFSVFNLFYLFKTSPNEIKMRTKYPPFKDEKKNINVEIIPQSETLEDKFSKNITLQDPNQDLVWAFGLYNVQIVKSFI